MFLKIVQKWRSGPVSLKSPSETSFCGFLKWRRTQTEYEKKSLEMEAEDELSNLTSGALEFKKCDFLPSGLLLWACFDGFNFRFRKTAPRPPRVMSPRAPPAPPPLPLVWDSSLVRSAPAVLVLLGLLLRGGGWRRWTFRLHDLVRDQVLWVSLRGTTR